MTPIPLLPRETIMGYLESISQHRIAPPEVSGTETVADLIDQRLLQLQRRTAPGALPGLHRKAPRARTAPSA